MKKVFALSMVLVGMLLFSACEKEMILPDSQQEYSSALKGAKKHTVPFRGIFTQEQTLLTGDFPVIYVVLEGVGTVTHLGKTRLWVGQDWDFSDFTKPGEGAAEVIFTAANGDELYADLYAFNATEVDGQGNPVYATVWGSGTFTGGTGRFLDASGTYDLMADYNFVTGVSNAFYRGEIMY